MKKSLYLLPVMILMLSACGNKQADVGTSAKVEDSTVNTSQNENSSAKEASQKDNNTTKDGQESIRILEALLWLTDLVKLKSSQEMEDIFMW